jgi:hypothetical protein
MFFILLVATCTSTVRAERFVAFQLHGYADEPYCYVTGTLLISSSVRICVPLCNRILIYTMAVMCSTRLCSLKLTNVLVLTGIILIKDKFPHLISRKVPQTDVVCNTELYADMKLTSSVV